MTTHSYYSDEDSLDPNIESDCEVQKKPVDTHKIVVTKKSVRDGWTLNTNLAAKTYYSETEISPIRDRVKTLREIPLSSSPYDRSPLRAGSYFG